MSQSGSPLRVYVASSWRNALQPYVVLALREDGHEVYDFREPSKGNHGFSWHEIDPSIPRGPADLTLDPEAIRSMLTHPAASLRSRPRSGWRVRTAVTGAWARVGGGPAVGEGDQHQAGVAAASFARRRLVKRQTQEEPEMEQPERSNIPHSPIAGGDDGFGVPVATGKEVRRARAVVEVIYLCRPGEFIDIQANIYDALDDVGLETGGVMGSPASVAVDLTEHVVLAAGGLAPEG